MGLCDVSNAEPLVCRRLEVLIEAPVRIDNECLSGGGTADDIAGLSQLGIKESLENHSD
jgi:hypothetical protein